MDLGIAGKRALVCGASAGLGYACAQALTQEGVDVMIVARTESTVEAAAEQLRALAGPDGGRVQALAADVTTAAGRESIFDAGRDFDIVVTNAGGPPAGDFRNWQREDWLAAIDANMLAPIELIKASVDGMMARGFGRIVNITSSAVKAPIDILGLSNGARSGLTGFVAGLSRTTALAGNNVTINNLLPGAFDTDRLKTTLAGAASKTGQTIEALAEARKKLAPAQRFGHPDEFGQTCAFLCSQHAGFITGQNILIDGGAYPGSH